MAAAADGTDYLTTEPLEGDAGTTAFLAIDPTHATATLEPIAHASTPALDSTSTPYLLPVLALSPDVINAEVGAGVAGSAPILKRDGAAWSSLPLPISGGWNAQLLALAPNGSPTLLAIGPGMGETVPAPATLQVETDGGWTTANLEGGLTLWAQGSTGAAIAFDDSGHSYTLFATGGTLEDDVPTSLVEAIDGVGAIPVPELSGVGYVYAISPAGDAGAPVVLELVGNGAGRFALARPGEPVVSFPSQVPLPPMDCSASSLTCVGSCTIHYTQDGGEALVRTADGTIWLVDVFTQFDQDETLGAPSEPGTIQCTATVTADRSFAVLEVQRIPLDGSMPTLAWDAHLPALPPNAEPGSPGWGLWASASGQRIVIAVDQRIVELDTSRF